MDVPMIDTSGIANAFSQIGSLAKQQADINGQLQTQQANIQYEQYMNSIRENLIQNGTVNNREDFIAQMTYAQKNITNQLANGMDASIFQKQFMTQKDSEFASQQDQLYSLQNQYWKQNTVDNLKVNVNKAAQTAGINGALSIVDSSNDIIKSLSEGDQQKAIDLRNSFIAGSVPQIYQKTLNDNPGISTSDAYKLTLEQVQNSGIQSGEDIGALKNGLQAILAPVSDANLVTESAKVQNAKLNGNVVYNYDEKTGKYIGVKADYKTYLDWMEKELIKGENGYFASSQTHTDSSGNLAGAPMNDQDRLKLLRDLGSLSSGASGRVSDQVMVNFYSGLQKVSSGGGNVQDYCQGFFKDNNANLSSQDAATIFNVSKSGNSWNASSYEDMRQAILGDNTQNSFQKANSIRGISKVYSNSISTGQQLKPEDTQKLAANISDESKNGAIAGDIKDIQGNNFHFNNGSPDNFWMFANSVGAKALSPSEVEGYTGNSKIQNALMVFQNQWAHAIPELTGANNVSCDFMQGAAPNSKIPGFLIKGTNEHGQQLSYLVTPVNSNGTYSYQYRPLIQSGANYTINNKVAPRTMVGTNKNKILGIFGGDNF